MGDKTKIAWADATLNPAYGCSRVSPACEHCYAEAQAHRLGDLTAGTVKGGRWTGKVNLFPDRMRQAFAWRKPRRIFVGSMTDLFHENVPDAFLHKVFAYMALSTQHLFMVLTKRAERMMKYMTKAYMPGAVGDAIVRIGEEMGSPLYPPKGGLPWPLPNVGLGVTIEDQDAADKRTPLLVETPAAWRFVSIEPILGMIDLSPWLSPPECSGVSHMGMDETISGDPLLDWVLSGAESGPNARPWSPAWARSLRDQCAYADVAFMWKQNGEWAPYDPNAGFIPTKKNGYPWGTIGMDGTFTPQATAWNGDAGVSEFGMVRVGKHNSGHLLDGVEHMAVPECAIPGYPAETAWNLR